MKKRCALLIILLSLINGLFAHNAHCISAVGCDSICPDPQIPFESKAFTPYSEVITLVLDSAYHNGKKVSIDSLYIVSVTGMPDNTTWFTECGYSVSCKYFPDTLCMLIGGTPTKAGTYTLTINIQVYSKTDGAFLLNLPNYTWIVTENLLELSTTANEVSSFGLCDGSASVVANKGTPPFTYLWESGESTQTITSKCSNVYRVVVTDSTGIKDSINAYISEPSITITPEPTNPETIIDTIYGHLDTCIINCAYEIDSAVITSYTLLDSTHAIFNFRIYHFQNANKVDLSTVYRYNKEGRTLVVLQINCEGTFSKAKALKTCYIEDDIFIDYSTITIQQIVVSEYELQIKKSTVYPNPFMNELIVQVPEPSIISIKTINGSEIIKLPQSMGSIKINTANYSSGVYILTIQNNYSIEQYKIIKSDK